LYLLYYYHDHPTTTTSITPPTTCGKALPIALHHANAAAAIAAKQLLSCFGRGTDGPPASKLDL